MRIIDIVALAIIGLANCVWQNVHCGTPTGCTDPLQVAPCEPVDKIKAEIDDLTERAKRNGPRQKQVFDPAQG